MSERVIVLALLLGACGPREVVVDIHTPEVCCEGCEPACPLEGVGSVLTILERVDGTPAERGCEPVLEPLCTLEELSGFVLLPRVLQPSDSVEVRVEGYAGESCDGALAFGCDSFGEHVIDLEHDERVSIWCECPFTP